jgi:hypothetical protein
MTEATKPMQVIEASIAHVQDLESGEISEDYTVMFTGFPTQEAAQAFLSAVGALTLREITVNGDSAIEE